MIIVADSGGSKIDWRLLKKDGSIGQAYSAGFNPYYQPIEHLKKLQRSRFCRKFKRKFLKFFFMEPVFLLRRMYKAFRLFFQSISQKQVLKLAGTCWLLHVPCAGTNRALLAFWVQAQTLACTMEKKLPTT